MPRENGLLDDLADAVLDGGPVDWATAEVRAGDDRSVVGHLRLLEVVARFHRGILPEASGSNRSPSTSLPTDEHWGHLRILEPVGEGTFGRVFRAWDTRLDREVALKLLPAHSSSDHPDPLETLREGRLLAKVRHPSVVTVYGAEQIGDEVGVWMEFVRGSSLEDLVRRDGPLPETDVIRIGEELGRAVSAVHAAGLLHRDIKGQNVVRADDGRIVLMDFGAGREVADEAASDLTGTPLYLAPEVLAGAAASVRSDVYSVGVLLYHLLTRTFPVTGRTIRAVRSAHAGGERRALKHARPDLGSRVARVVERAADPDPARRYASADALVSDLSGIARPRSVRVIRHAAAIVALALVGGAVWETGARLFGSPRTLTNAWAGMLGRPAGFASGPAILVLPFENAGDDARDDVLVDNVTSGLIGQLALIDGLEVRSQTSSFMLRGTPQSRSDLAARLNVNLIVEGEVRIAGGDLTVDASLVSTADGSRIWSEQLVRPIASAGDLSGVVEELTRTMVNRLRLTVGRTERRYATDIATLRQYLAARAQRDLRGAGANEATALLRDVVESDPSFAPAQAALAATYGIRSLDYPAAGDNALPPREAAALIAPLAERALAIDPMLGEAHAALGYVHVINCRWPDAEAAFRRAIELEPSLSILYGDFVLAVLEPWGRLDEATRLLESALEADPLSPDLHRLLGHTHLNAGRYDKALDELMRARAARPGLPFIEEHITRTLFFMGRRDEAMARFAEWAVGREGVKGYILAINGQRVEAEAIAAQFAHLPQRQAEIYSYLGDRDRTFEAIERLAAINPRRALSFLTYPELRLLQGDPRVDELRVKLGLP